MARRDTRIGSLRELWALIREDLKSNGTVFEPGFQALAVHRFGVWKHGIEPKLLRIPFTVVYRLLNVFVRNVYGIELYINTRIGRRLLIGHQHGIIVHPNAAIGDDCVIIQGVTIGQGGDTRGSLPPPAPKLGNRVKVGAGAVIAGDITIGDDVRIGPNAVVMTDVPAGAIVSAPPSRIMAMPPRRQRGDGAGERPARGKLRQTRYERLLEGAGAGGARLAGRLATASRQVRQRLPAADPAGAARRDVAAGVAAPALVSYVLATLLDARTRGIERLYFLSRDGQVLQELADILAPRLGITIERRYLYASRQAWNRAIGGARLGRWLWNDTGHGATLTDTLRRLAVPRAAVAADLAGQDLPSPDAPLSQIEIDRLRPYFESERFAAAATTAQSENRRLLTAYLEQEGMFDAARKATVDLGWTGSQHETLSDLLAARGSPPCPCYLFGAKAVDGPWADLRHGFLFDENHPTSDDGHALPARDLFVLMEMFCAADHGTLAGFVERGGRVEPDLAEGWGPRALAWGLPDLRATVAEVAAEVELADIGPADLVAMRPAIDALLAMFWQSPTPAEARVWGRFPWDAGQGHEAGVFALAEPYRLRDAPAAWRPRRLKKRDVFWVEGAFAMTPRPVAEALHGVSRLRRALGRIRRKYGQLAGMSGRLFSSHCLIAVLPVV